MQMLSNFHEGGIVGWWQFQHLEREV